MYFTSISEVGITRPIMTNTQRPVRLMPQQQTTVQNQQPVQQPQQQIVQPQQNVQQSTGTKLNAAIMNKRQIPNGSKNTVNILRQAQKPLNMRK